MIDSVSSLWCMIHGYKNKEINEAMKNQIDQFSHVMLGGLTHEPVLKLSEKLKDFLPGDLDYCFFRFGFGCCRGCLENGIAI